MHRRHAAPYQSTQLVPPVERTRAAVRRGGVGLHPHIPRPDPSASLEAGRCQRGKTINLVKMKWTFGRLLNKWLLHRHSFVFVNRPNPPSPPPPHLPATNCTLHHRPRLHLQSAICRAAAREKAAACWTSPLSPLVRGTRDVRQIGGARARQQPPFFELWPLPRAAAAAAAPASQTLVVIKRLHKTGNWRRSVHLVDRSSGTLAHWQLQRFSVVSNQRRQMAPPQLLGRFNEARPRAPTFDNSRRPPSAPRPQITSSAGAEAE